MRKIALIIFSLLVVNTAFSQSKKDLDQKIIQLEERLKTLENEIVYIKTNLTNTTTTLGLVSKNMLELDIIVKNQNLLIEKLIRQNDSLLIAFKAGGNTDLVTVPQNEEDSIIFLIQSYYSCKKWDQRQLYVLNSDKIAQFMEEYYKDSYSASIIKKDEISIQGSDFEFNQVFKVIVINRIFYCKKTTDGFKIDWMATTGYNAVSLKTFKANQTTEPTEFRVYASIGSYYSFNYRDAENTHWSISISDDNENDIIGCYISKNSIEGQKIYEILKDGKYHQLILEIKIDNSADKSGNIAIITKLIQDGWSKE